MSSALHRKNLAAAGPEKFTMEYIQKQVEEFDIGKRHLANMMGEDPENFTQEDIDVSESANMQVLLSVIVFFMRPLASANLFCRSSLYFLIFLVLKFRDKWLLYESRSFNYLLSL